VLFVGQSVDACMTPTVGFLSDRFTNLPFGQRKSWHLLGSVLVVISFPFVFGSNFKFVDDLSKTGLVVWACSYVTLFQIGWASTQVAHLSLIPELTSDCNERDFLNTARYACTIMSSVTVFGLAFGLLESSSGRELGPSDMFHFALLAYIVVGLGSILVLYFHLGVTEPSHIDKLQARRRAYGQRSVVWTDWFKRPLFYQVGGIYMTSRLIVNISQVYLPLFLIDTLQMNKINISVAPLSVFIVGLLTTSLQKVINLAVGRRNTLLFGILVVLGTSVGAYFVSASSPYVVYAVVVGLGVGGTTVLVTALAMEADLIGDDVEGSAFVYGALSFLDKLANGAAVLIIQFMAESQESSSSSTMSPNKAETTCEVGSFYRTVIVFVPGVAAIVCAIFSFSTYSFGGYSEYSQKNEHLGQSSSDGHPSPDVTRSLLISPTTSLDSSPSDICADAFRATLHSRLN